jgi:hypothetical protein
MYHGSCPLVNRSRIPWSQSMPPTRLMSLLGRWQEAFFTNRFRTILCGYYSLLVPSHPSLPGAILIM